MSERAPMPPVPGLARTASIPPPPPRRAAAPARPTTTAAPRTTGGAERLEPERSTAAPASASTTPAAGTQSSREPRRPARRQASDEADVMRPITLSLPAAIVTQVKDRARVERVSQPEVVMDALTANHDELGELLQEGKRRQLKSDGLFLRSPTVRGTAEPMATMSMRMLARNVEAIDRLVQTHGAPSRSALCLAALRAYLVVDTRLGERVTP